MSKVKENDPLISIEFVKKVTCNGNFKFDNIQDHINSM